MDTPTMQKDRKQFLLDQRYLAMARIWSQNSYCNRRQVGAIIVKKQNDYQRWL